MESALDAEETVSGQSAIVVKLDTLEEVLVCCVPLRIRSLTAFNKLIILFVMQFSNPVIVIGRLALVKLISRP